MSFHGEPPVVAEDDMLSSPQVVWISRQDINALSSFGIQPLRQMSISFYEIMFILINIHHVYCLQTTNILAQPDTLLFCFALFCFTVPHISFTRLHFVCFTTGQLCLAGSQLSPCSVWFVLVCAGGPLYSPSFNGVSHHWQCGLTYKLGLF